MTEFFDAASAEIAKKRLAETHEQTKTAAPAEHGKGRPTPTQEENDLSALGAHILLHDDDGSAETRHMESAAGGAGYQTRQTGAATTAAAARGPAQQPARPATPRSE